MRPQAQPEPLAVSVAEAAAMIGISRAAFYPYLSSGKCPSALLGGRRVVLVSSLTAFLAAHEQGRELGAAGGTTAPAALEGRRHARAPRPPAT